MKTQGAGAGADVGCHGVDRGHVVENVFDRAYRRHLSTRRGNVALEPGRNAFASVTLER